MEQEYVIGVANRYALFLEETSHEEDPYEIIKNAEVEKTKKKTLKSVSGESKENKGKPDLKGKTTLPSGRKAQGIKETQNVKANDAGAVNKPKPQDGGLKNNNSNINKNNNTSNNNANNNNNSNSANNRAAGRKPGDRPQGDRPPTSGDGSMRTVKFASGEPQGERTNNRRPREDKTTGERNGDVPRMRNFREGDRGSKGVDNENGPRGPRNEEGRRGPRRDGERPFRGGDRDRNDRQGGDGEGRPPRREFRERRDFQERTDFPREGAENGENRLDRRPGPPMGRTKGNRQGGGPGRNFDNRGKREFDRKSGSDKTGVKAVDKRDGGGAHNWGNHKDDLEAVNNLNSTNASEENADWTENKPLDNDVAVNDSKDGEKNTADSEPAPPVEEEPKELTLDEYRALRGKRELPQYNIRKAGEGEDLTQWKNMYEIKKKKDSENQEEEEVAEYDTTEYPQRVGRQKVLLDIDITFSDSRRGSRGGRGGRAPRPGGLSSAPGNNRTRQRDGPRRGQRDDRNEYGAGRDREYRENRQAAPKVDDEHDFPSLG